MASYFISDLHLEPGQPQILRGLQHLLGQLQAGDKLYLLGDIFEYWIGDDVSNGFVDGIKTLLREHSQRGITLYFMHGNRDFLVGQSFCQQSGATLLPDPSIVDVNGEKVLLMHGDSLCTRDTAYMQFRQMARNPQWQAMFLGKTPQERIEFANAARKESQAKGQQNMAAAAEILDVTPEEVPLIMAQHGVTTLIHGHTHRPAVHNLQVNGQAARRIVLGDWYNKGWMLHNRAGELQLESFELN
ncbi:MAG: UDP-2,3-diacylglucosamine diphosphatase [Oceanospirillaceae bacterium]|nr:UDP-2,3-diacylglucosamine diphosphatase [Oceanospirillaceae bacterium]MCP5334128.1 UDP-2,3-diacylglucosamine diphosphatase [Oceanospirillaceae bacterium]